MAIPKPDPRDWQIANAKELQVTDRQVLQLLRDAKKNVDAILKDLPEGSVKRAQLEHTRSRLLAQQSTLFERLGDTVAARRASAASRAARLSAASDAVLLGLVGKSPEAQYLYESALQVGQRAIDAAMQRMKLSALPLSRRIYNTSVWMNGRLGKLINETLASGLDAKAFAKRARDWFNPNTPGGVRYAAMRLARTEINNAFHSISAEKYATTPWCTGVDWNLSKSHPKPDICNKVAADSPFPKAEVPARPHPQCMCYITASYEDEDDFVENFLEGKYDDYLDAELEKNGWQEQPPDPTPIETGVDTAKPASKPQSPAPVIASTPNTPPKALSGEDAINSVPKGLFKRGSMTPEQRAGLKVYNTGWFAVINGALRDDNRWDDPEYAKEVRDIGRIDSAMDGSLLPRDIQVWRGMFHSTTVFGDRYDHDLTGFSWEDKAYGSTTADERIIDDFHVSDTESPRFKGQNVKMKVTVSAGTKALASSTFQKGAEGKQSQAEITLQRGVKWKVVKDNGYDENGIRQLEVRADPIGQQSHGSGETTTATGTAVHAADPVGAIQSESASSGTVVVPASIARRPEIDEFGVRQIGVRFFGDVDPDSILELTDSQIYDKLADESLFRLQATTYLPTDLQMLRAIDANYARLTGKPNEGVFESRLVGFLTTPQGVTKARETQARYAAELAGLKDLDALSREAEALNGKQPDLPADSAGFKAWTTTQAEEFWNGAQPLTAGELAGLRYYSTSPGYQAMNRYLRVGADSIKGNEKQKAIQGIAETRQALRPLTQSIVVDRVASSEQFNSLGLSFKRAEAIVGITGKTFKDNGFTSTAVLGGKLTTDKNLRSGSVKMEIELPAGIPVAYMEKLTRHKGEHELMLTDGVEFKVLRVDLNANGGATVRVRAVNWPGRES